MSNKTEQIRFITFEAYHGKKDVGSTKIRVHQLIKHWPEANLYKYGENPDVLVFQKVYCQADYKFPAQFEGLKILDVCDPDWLEHQAIKETCDAVDGITVPTQALADFITQLTDKPVKVVPDRFDLTVLPSRKIHSGQATKAVWFGYKHNAELMRLVVPALEAKGISLTVISNEDPMMQRWAEDPESYNELYHFSKYNEDEFYSQMQKHDICILPIGNRPQDRFKSNNRTVKSWLAGIPVVTNMEELEKYLDPVARNTESAEKYNLAKKEYDCIKSVTDMKDFIEVIRDARKN